MEESAQNFSKKIWLKLVVLTAIVLIAALSLINYYQISILKQELGEVKTTISGKVEPALKVVESLKASIAPAPSTTVNEPIEIVGLIQRSDLEGGCWYIQPELPECKDDKCPLNVMGVPANYEPLNLPKELQKTGLKAKFKLEVQPGVATICQLGPVVKILDYQIIK